MTRHFALLFISLCALLGPTVSGAAEPDAPRVRITTTLGDIDVVLDPVRAPETVANFLDLVDSGFYEGLIFHRVIANFMIQTGGYDRALGYREPPRQVRNESANGLRNLRGTLAMARLDPPDSADSQFFINVNDNAHLDPAPGRPGYTVFGRVVDGMDVVTGIELVNTHIAGGMAGVPETPVLIQRIVRLP
ncbi:MAG: peptidylprolyl isomerase [Pseudomonadales bacterium]|nr:peptidylprolyl isomerase [Pseudomonadales bacterium]